MNLEEYTVDYVFVDTNGKQQGFSTIPSANGGYISVGKDGVQNFRGKLTNAIVTKYGIRAKPGVILKRSIVQLPSDFPDYSGEYGCEYDYILDKTGLSASEESWRKKKVLNFPEKWESARIKAREAGVIFCMQIGAAPILGLDCAEDVWNHRDIQPRHVGTFENFVAALDRGEIWRGYVARVWKIRRKS